MGPPVRRCRVRQLHRISLATSCPTKAPKAILWISVSVPMSSHSLGDGLAGLLFRRNTAYACRHRDGEAVWVASFYQKLLGPLGIELDGPEIGLQIGYLILPQPLGLSSALAAQERLIDELAVDCNR